MNRCLILLTNYYPFYRGEEYLETEIGYLSKKFSKIYLIPTMVNDKMKMTRKIPSNVELLTSNVNSSIKGKASMIVSEYLDIRKNKNITDRLKEDLGNSIIKNLYGYYFECRAIHVYKKIEEIINQYDFSEYDNIILYSYWFYITARVAVEMKNKMFSDKKTYLISRAHGYDINVNASPVKFLPEREYLLDQLDNVFPCSMNGVNYLKNTYSKYAHKVDVRRLGTIKSNDISNVSKESFHIVSCSTVRKLKRIDLIVDALSLLEKETLDIKWTHIGAGPEFENIKQLVSKKIEFTNVNLLGFLSNKDVLKWYENNKVSVFVNVSSSEGVPVSIMEAMSMSIPIIATNAGGTSEIVGDNINGYLIDLDCNGEMLYKKIKEMIELDDEEYEKLSKASYEIWNERCNADKLYKQFAEELYDRKK